MTRAGYYALAGLRLVQTPRAVPNSTASTATQTTPATLTLAPLAMVPTRVLILSSLALPLACVGSADNGHFRAKASSVEFDTSDPSAEEGGDPSAGDGDGGGGGDGPTDGESCEATVNKAIELAGLPNGFTPHPDGGAAIPQDAAGCKELDLSGQGQAYCDIKFNEPLGLQGDPAGFFVSGEGDDLTCGCGCPDDVPAVGACEELELAIESGELPGFTLENGVALFPYSGKFCEELDMASGQGLCDSKVAGPIGEPLGAYPFTTVMIDDELHCGCACDDPELCLEPEVSLDFAWFPAGVPGSGQGTLSKVRVSDGVEVGRYLVSEALGFSPSRVGVSLNGVAATSGRFGGVVAVASGDDCPNPAATSTGPDDVLPFPDGCVLWELESPWPTQAANSHRPLAWTPGTWDSQTCRYENTKVWTAQVGDGVNKAIRIDGDTGEIDLSVPLDEVEMFGSLGLYGGVADAEGTFWTHAFNTSTLVRISSNGTLSQIPAPSPVNVYGSTMDAQGRVFLCGAGGIFRYDPADESWAVSAMPDMRSPCDFDGVDRLWLRHGTVNGGQVVAVDVNTLEIVDTVPSPPGTSSPHGFAVDFDDNLWVLPHANGAADSVFRVDLETGEQLEVLLPEYVYTYNSFAGRRLAAVAAGG